MNVIEYLQKQLESMWYLQDSACKDVTGEQLMTIPPGTVSPIGVIWLHMLNGQDNFLSAITGKPPLWKIDGWRERFGLEIGPAIGEDWSPFEHAALGIENLQEYSQAVREYGTHVLAATEAGSLDERIKFFTGSDPKADVWVLLVGHTLLHCGEIAAIKGMLGGEGLPF